MSMGTTIVVRTTQQISSFVIGDGLLVVYDLDYVSYVMLVVLGMDPGYADVDCIVDS